MKPAKDMKNTLRYKLMVKNLKSRPPHVKEAALLKEIVGGKQWRMDAVLEAIEATPGAWADICIVDVFKQAGMFGRLATIRRMSKTLEYDLFDPKKDKDHARPHGVLAAFNMAVIHGHYKTADYCGSLGAQPSTEMTFGNTRYAMFTAIQTADMRMLDYVLKHDDVAEYLLEKSNKQIFSRVDKKVIDCLQKHIALQKKSTPPQP